MPFRVVLAVIVSFGLFLGTCRGAAAQTPGTDHVVSVFGAKIHYVEAGRGPVVILVHGLADDVSVWESTLAALSAQHRVVALDQVGFGASDKPLLSYRAGTFVDFLDGFMKELGIERASLVGSSLGGWVAAGFALEHPDRVDRLVLLDAAGFGTLARTLSPRTLSALRLATRDDLRTLGPLTFHDPHFYAEAGLDAAFTQRVAAGDGYTVGKVVESILRGEDVLDGRLGRLHLPVLIVWGRADGLIPLSFGERFHREIRGSRLLVLEKCGHMPQIECAPELDAALLRFLAGG